MAGGLRGFRYPIRPLEAIVLIHHVLHCPDAENDAEKTVIELTMELDAWDGYVSKAVLESALYCCNIENEKRKFWHPLKQKFDGFVDELLPVGKHFDRYYNCIYDKKKDVQDGPDAKTRR